MKSGVFVLAIILCLTFVSAADVAYLYRSEGKIDQHIVDIFEEMGLDVDLVNEDIMGDLSSYSLIFVGDENFRRDIPIWEHSSVIMNHYNSEDFGLTDRDGVSKIGASSPLYIERNGMEFQVYQRAFRNGRVAVPYYYIDEQNKADALTQIASSRKTSSGANIGDVVSIVEPGEVLMNGKTAEKKICFFGITETDVWTEDAKTLFVECADLTLSECETDNDCPSDEFIGDEYCVEDDVYQNERIHSCVEQNSVRSCVPAENGVLIEQCSYGCFEGNCIRCNEDLDCDDNNNETEDFCIMSGSEESHCSNEDIECFSDEECGADGFVGELFCSENESAQMYQMFMCNNPGTAQSSCSSLMEERTIEECSDFCLEGTCMEFVCHDDLDCNDGNERTEDKCLNMNTINSECVNDEILCFANSECGEDGFIGEQFCSERDIVQTFVEYTCDNPGTVQSSCSSETVDFILQTCGDSCSNGQCVGIECYSETECGEDGLTGLYCSENNSVSQAYFNFSCENAGTVDSFCTLDIAEETIEMCAENCVDGICVGSVECSLDDDCPADSNSAPFCHEGVHVFMDVTTYSCENPGTTSSECVATNSQELVDSCEFGCENGMCLPPAGEGVHDVGFAPTNTYINGVRVQDSDENDIVNESLICGNDYKISLRVRNFGNFSENVTFSGSIGAVDIQHNPIMDFAPGAEPSRTKTVNINLTTGTYNMTIETFVEGFTDENPVNNIAVREFNVEFPD